MESPLLVDSLFFLSSRPVCKLKTPKERDTTMGDAFVFHAWDLVGSRGERRRKREEGRGREGRQF